MYNPFMHDASSYLPALPKRSILTSIIAGFFALTFIVYGASLGNAFVAWDDDYLIVSNALIRGFSWQHIKDAFTSFDPELYDPLTMLSYMLDYSISGKSAWMFHFTNLVLHTLNALGVAWLIALLSRKKYIGIVAGLLFAIHPLNVEAVAWAAARKDVLSTFFFLGSVIAYVYWQSRKQRATRNEPTSNKGSYFLYYASLLLFFLGLLSKVMVLTLPVVLLLIDYLHERKWSLKVITEKIPYFLLSIIFGIVALFAKRGAVAESTPLQKILMACKSTVYYIEKLIWPSDLSVLYPYSKPITLTSPDFLIPIFVIFVIIVFLVILRRYRAITFGILFYLLTLSPTFLNFAKGGKFYFASDRYTYIPQIGLLFLLLVLVDLWLQKNPKSIVKQSSILGFIGILGLFGFLTYKQSLTWKNTETLFLHTFQYYPDAVQARINLGFVYRESNLINKALDQFNEVLRIDPHFALAYTNIGVIYEKQGRNDEAMAEYKKGIAADKSRTDSYLSLGMLYEKLGRNDEAFEMYQTVQKMNPNFAGIYNNLGSIYVQKEDWKNAEDSYKKGIAINPYYSDAHFNLAYVYTKTNRPSLAVDEYVTTLKLEGDKIATLQLLATIYAEENKAAETIGILKRMLVLEPTNEFATKLLDALREHGIGE